MGVVRGTGLALGVALALLAATPALAADPARWAETGRSTVPLYYYQGITSDPAALHERFPQLVVTAITPYGLEGPYADRPATELTLQAESGALAVRGRPGREPVQAGGRTMEWVSGLYAAVAVMSMKLLGPEGFMDFDGRVLVEFGAKEPFRIAHGQWWRYVTAGFLHGGLLHFAMNSWVLFDLGRYKEAIEAYSNVSSLYPDEPFVLETFVQISNCWRRLDRHDNARGAVKQAQIVLDRLPAESDFASTTVLNREEWRMLLANMSKW